MKRLNLRGLDESMDFMFESPTNRSGKKKDVLQSYTGTGGGDENSDPNRRKR